MDTTITKKNEISEDIIIEKLKTIYDPEFPMVDIYTLGLIYKVTLIETENQKEHKSEKKIHILMTFTTPACPMADLLQEMIKNSMHEIAPTHTVDLEISFDPMRSPSMIKDEDLKRMFDM